MAEPTAVDDKGNVFVVRDGQWVPQTAPAATPTGAGGASLQPQAAPQAQPGKLPAVKPDNPNAPQPGLGAYEDTTRSALPEFMRGIVGTAALPRTLYDVGRTGAQAMAGEQPPPSPDKIPAPSNPVLPPGALPGGWPTYDSMIGAVEKAVPFPMYKPQTPVGKFVGTALQTAPSAMLMGGPAGMLARGVQGTLAGLGSEAGAQLAEKLTDSPALQGAARVVGGLAGPSSLSALRRGVTPNPNLPAAAMDQKNLLNNAGVDVAAGQVLGPGKTANIEGRLLATGGGRGFQPHNQQADVVNALMRTTGAPGGPANFRNLGNASADLDQAERAAAASTQMLYPPTFMNDLQAIQRNYGRMSGGTDTIDLPKYFTGPMNAYLANPAAARSVPVGLSGDQYLYFRNAITKDMASASPQKQQMLLQVRNQFDDAMNQSTAGTRHAGVWDDVRSRRDNMGAIEAGSNVRSPHGLDVPSAANAARKIDPNSEVAQLGEAATQRLGELPNKPTGDWLARALGFAGGAAGGYYAGRNLPVPHSGELGAATGAAIGHQTGKAAADVISKGFYNKPVANAWFSEPWQKYLLNQQWQPGPASTSNKYRNAQALSAGDLVLPPLVSGQPQQ